MITLFTQLRRGKRESKNVGERQPRLGEPCPTLSDAFSEFPLKPHLRFRQSPEPFHDMLVVGVGMQRALANRTHEFRTPGWAVKCALLQTILGGAHDLRP